MRPRSFGLTVAIGLLLLLPACMVTEEDDDPDLVQMTAEVEAFDNYFQSTTLILEPDTEATVNFTNNGSSLHSFTIPDLDVEIEAQGAESSTVTFATTGLAGAYEFLCKYHPDEMIGTLTIQADADVEADEDVDVDVDVDETDDGDL